MLNTGIIRNWLQNSKPQAIGQRYCLALCAVFFIGLVGYSLLTPSNVLTKLDGSLEDWDENLFQKDDEELTPNPSIDIEQYAAETDAVYLNGVIVTKLLPFPKYSNNVLYVFIDVDGDNDTGYWIPGLGAEFRLEITATSWILNNQTNSFEPVLSGILQVHDASRSRYDLNSFLPLTSFKVVTKDVIEFQLPLFDISSNSNSNIKLFFYMIDDQSNFDTSDWIYGINIPSINFDSSKDIERANHNSYYDSDGEIDIDGSFQDWYSPFSSVERYDDGIDSALNPDIDLRDYATSALSLIHI